MVRPTSLIRGNGVTTTYGYDGGSRLNEQDLYFPNAAYNQYVDYGYNAAGQITERTATNDLYAWQRHYNVSRPYTANALNQYSAIGAAPDPLIPSYDVKGNLAQAGGALFLHRPSTAQDSDLLSATVTVTSGNSQLSTSIPYGRNVSAT